MFSNRFIYRTFIGVITLMIAVCMSPPTMAQSGQPVCQISYAGSWVDNGIGFLEYGFSWHNTTPGTVTATFAMLDQVYVFNANESYEEIRLHASPNSRSIASLLVEAANGTCYATSEKIIPALPGNPEANPPMCQVSYHHGWLDNGSGHAEFGYSWHNTIQGTVNTRFNYLGQEVTHNDWEAYYQVYTPAGINTNPVGRITVISQNGSCIATGIAQVPDIPPLPQCPSGTGPGGITAGDYDSGSLTPEQRQWLWNIFGNNPNEQAPVGYGGQHCAGQQPVLPECPSGTGPGGIVAGDHDSSTLTQEQRNWLYWAFGNNPNEQAPVGYGGQPCNWTQPQIPPCPAGVGEPGDFSFMSLTQQQRNELYWAFGHTGEAPVGYNGESCYGGTLTLPSFTGGSGGDGSNPTATPVPIPTQSGSNPTVYSGWSSLPTTDQGQYIQVTVTGLNVRSSASTSASVVGQLTNGHYYRLLNTNGDWGQIEPPGWQGPASFGWSYLTGYTNTFNISGGTSSTIHIPVEHFGITYDLTVNSQTCAIINGSMIVSMEMNRFRGWIDQVSPIDYYPALYNYLRLNGDIDQFRVAVQNEVISNTDCQSTYYLIDNLYMDTSGLGNIMYGYITSDLNIFAVSLVADLDQKRRDGDLTVVDWPDDHVQIIFGRTIAEWVSNGSPINPSVIESAAVVVNLQ